MTCLAHGTPERRCSLCGHDYCDGNDHGHTPQVCVSMLERGRDVAIGNLVHFTTNLKEAEHRLQKHKEDFLRREDCCAALQSGTVARLKGVLEEVVANLSDRSGDYLAVLDAIAEHAKAALADLAEQKQ